MSKIKAHIQKLERGVVFQILEQNIKVDDIISVDGVKVRITSDCMHPQITLTANKVYTFIDGRPIKPCQGNIRSVALYLRGLQKSKDYDVITMKFNDNEIRNKVFNLIKKSLHKICQ